MMRVGNWKILLFAGLLPVTTRADVTATDILNILVDEGILTEEKATDLVEKVRTREEKLAQNPELSGLSTEQNNNELNVVRVPYLSPVVKRDISNAVKEEILDTVADDVMAQARAEGWGIQSPPEWVQNLSISGDVRVRYHGNYYPSDNPINQIFNINKINDNESVSGDRDVFVNVNEDRHRLQGRARLMFLGQPSDNVSVGVRLLTGNQGNPVSANQTMGNYGGKWESNFDLAYITYQNDARSFRFDAGRIPNPWLSSDLIWDQDMTFEGLSTTYAPLHRTGTNVTWDPFIQVGAFPLQEIHLAVLPGDSMEPPNEDKWLYSLQLGNRLNFSENSVLSFAATYYQFDNIVGVDNAFNEDNQDATASNFYQFGNTVQNIVALDPDATTPRELFALASEFELLNLTLRYDYSGVKAHRLWMVADAVENKAFDVEAVSARIGSGFLVPERDSGYQLELGFGTEEMEHRGDWSMSFVYRYLEGDAVVDAFADSDFLLGGTNAKGYILRGDFILTKGLWLTMRWLSAEEIDAADVPDPANPGQFIESDVEVDTFLLDLNAKF